MRVHDTAFYGAGFFLLGILFKNLNFSLAIVVFISALLAVLFLLGNLLGLGDWFKPTAKSFWLAGFTSILLLGFLYASFYDAHQARSVNIIFDEEINFSGVVIKNSAIGDSQKLVAELDSPLSGKIVINLAAHPAFDYGDRLNFYGVIKKPPSPDYALRLSKDGVFGVSNSPRVGLLAKNQASLLKAKLLILKEKVINGFYRVLPPEKAAFISGITFGERAGFSDELRDAMNRSGTTHLIALSGYNISVISIAIGFAFSWVFGRRWAFFLSIAVIILFVLMTGAEASVVRAAIMGFILLLAKEAGRAYSLRNAAMFAAFIMIVESPKVLNFDIGFQLSFLSLLGIVYLLPALKKFFRASDDPGFLSWRENFWVTLSAQTAVFPILILYFGKISLFSLLANILILGLIPYTMGLGFTIGFLAVIFYDLALLLSPILNALLSWELGMIKFFGGLPVWEIESISLGLVGFYYLAIIIFLISTNFRRKSAYA